MNKRYDELFGEIVDILRHDWAGAVLAGEKLDPKYYNQSIGQAGRDGKLDDLLFLRHISQMLACTGDRHLRFALRPSDAYAPGHPGLFVRRYENALYVTAVRGKRGLAPGDRILAVNGGTPEEHRRRIQKNFFYADEPEREDWLGLLRMAEHVDIERPDGSRERLALKTYKYPPAPPKPRIYGTPKGVVFDLRNVPDLPETLLRECLFLICRKPTPLRELLDGDLYVNYTRRNCMVRAASIRGLDGSEGFIDELREKAGAGWLPEPDEDDTLIPGYDGPAPVVLIDTWTRGNAETLALAAKRAGAYLIGRPTLGTIDLCGDVSLELDERFVLTWPTAVTRAAREGRGVFGRGVAPDLYIPWTPAECAQDALLAAAQAHLTRNN